MAWDGGGIGGGRRTEHDNGAPRGGASRRIRRGSGRQARVRYCAGCSAPAGTRVACQRSAPVPGARRPAPSRRRGGRSPRRDRRRRAASVVEPCAQRRSSVDEAAAPSGCQRPAAAASSSASQARQPASSATVSPPAVCREPARPARRRSRRARAPVRRHPPMRPRATRCRGLCAATRCATVPVPLTAPAATTRGLPRLARACRRRRSGVAGGAARRHCRAPVRRMPGPGAVKVGDGRSGRGWRCRDGRGGSGALRPRRDGVLGRGCRLALVGSEPSAGEGSLRRRLGCADGWRRHRGRRRDRSSRGRPRARAHRRLAIDRLRRPSCSHRSAPRVERLARRRRLALHLGRAETAPALRSSARSAAPRSFASTSTLRWAARWQALRAWHRLRPRCSGCDGACQRRHRAALSRRCSAALDRWRAVAVAGGRCGRTSARSRVRGGCGSAGEVEPVDGAAGARSLAQSPADAAAPRPSGDPTTSGRPASLPSRWRSRRRPAVARARPRAPSTDWRVRVGRAGAARGVLRRARRRAP